MANGMMSELVQLALDEGPQLAIRNAEALRDSLETIMECADPSEQAHAGPLLETVNDVLRVLTIRVV